MVSFKCLNKQDLVMNLTQLVSILIVVILMECPAHAQIDTTFNKHALIYSDFLAIVGKNNLQLAAEKFTVSIAEASIENAKIFPNPQLYFGYFNTNQKRLALGYGYIVNATGTIELGGKRKARIDLATNDVQLHQALLVNFFKNLRADATLAYLDAIKFKSIFDVKLGSYKSINHLARLDSIRFKAGAVTEIDARQSRVEAISLLNETYRAEMEWKVSLANLGFLLGKRPGDTLFVPIGRPDSLYRSFELEELLVTAENNRADLLAAMKNKNVAESNLNLVKANRVIDLGITIGVNNTATSTSYFAPTPSFTQVSGALSVPLKFSNNYKGDLKIANYNIAQADVLYRQAELQVQTEVTQAFFNYVAAGKQVKQFRTQLLSEAKFVLNGRTYSYQRGQSLLLEVLIAQRTNNEIQLNYLDALYNYAAALVELERAAGIWDINF